MKRMRGDVGGLLSRRDGGRAGKGARREGFQACELAVTGVAWEGGLLGGGWPGRRVAGRGVTGGEEGCWAGGA
ncbi:hypothetical protein AAC387_Pa10g0847 [Persea americana]